MSPEMKEDSDCFLTVSFHIRLMRLCAGERRAIDQGSARRSSVYEKASVPEDGVATQVHFFLDLNWYTRFY